MIIDSSLSNNGHLVRTTHEWQSTSIKYKIIPKGCLCVELTTDGNTKIKVGEGNKYYEQLSYIESDVDMDEVVRIVKEYLETYATKEYVDNEIHIVDGKVHELDEQIVVVTEHLSETDDRVSNNKNSISDLNQTVSSYDNRIESLESKAHTHSNKQILDDTTASYTSQEKNKLSNIEDNANYYELLPATKYTLGGIKVGNNLEITTDGILSATGGGTPYELPPATRTDLGGIIVGNNLEITSSGVLSATGGGSYTLPIATDKILGGIKVGNHLTINTTTGVLDADGITITDIGADEILAMWNGT